MSGAGRHDASARIASRRAAEKPAIGSRDRRVAEAVEAYLAEIEAGRHPRRDQFLRQYPNIAEELAVCVDGLEFVHHVAPQLNQNDGGPPASTGDAIQALRPLGDFRILREIGRGGMGVVYEAQQLSLNRRVALKVLPFAAVLDPRQLQRFKNEAQAAAALHHTNIVPVFSVGCERGVHYYAMQYIEGQTLSDVVSELQQVSGLDGIGNPLKSAVLTGSADVLLSGRYAVEPHASPEAGPTFVPAGEPDTSVTVPEAKDTALIAALSTERSTKSAAYFRSIAELGVKVAEAMEHAHQQGVIHRDIKPSNLILDAHGKVWVTDFGLAHIETDASLTMSGDLLGTLRYMSPEQVLAKRVGIDHRTDVYSLGVTLYELLTLRPAFSGNNRQLLLHQIAFEEPVPARRLVKELPADLEIIVQMAMAKNPEERYATAQELADDLKRYLESKPIHAKRPSLAERAVKWSRRHPAIVMSSAVVSVIAAVALAVSTVLVSRAFNNETQARHLAQGRERQAAIEAAKAREVSDLVQQMLSSANPDQSKGAAYTVREMLDEFSSGLTDQLTDQPDVEAAIRSTVGNAYRRLGLPDEAEAQLTRALDLRRGLFREQSAPVAASLLDQAWLKQEKNDYRAMETASRQALAIYHGLGLIEGQIAALRCLQLSLHQQSKFEQADELTRQAVGLVGKRHPDVASMLHLHSSALSIRKRFQEAESVAREAVALHRELRGPNHLETAWALYILAKALNGQGKYVEAESCCREALDIFREYFGDDHRSIVLCSEALSEAIRGQEAIPEQSVLQVGQDGSVLERESQ